jgi:hypothetical protein
MSAPRPDFSHMPARGDERAPLQNATRYLCAAAYLDAAFAQKVIKEFVEEDHRGVVPSFGFDIRPVVGHCLRARRMRIVRDAAIALALLLGVVLSAGATAGVMVILLMLAGMLLFVDAMRARGVALPAPVWAAAGVLVVLWLMSGFLPDLLNSAEGGTGGFPQGLDIGESNDSGQSGLWGKPVFAAVLLLIALPGASFGYRFMVYRTLRKLGPGSTEDAPGAVGGRARGNLDRVSAAQRGNITLYSRENPFLGSGDIGSRWARAWSIALELDRAAGDGPTGERLPREVDPVRLHRHVHDRLVAMRDGPRPNERISGLTVDWHVVAQGDCVQADRPVDPSGAGLLYRDGNPLIDRRRAVPYSRASERAIEAITRHPQADIRCYQRITVGTQGQAIRDVDDRVIAPAQYQDILLSAFLYLAVEGRMLYAQFVVNVLPPVRERFRVVDDLPAYSTGMVIGRVLREGGLGAFAEGALGPFRLVREGVSVAMEVLRANSGREPTSFVRFDYGARISVREEAAEPRFRTFMQTLDADKYINLIERRINEAVLDHLHHCDVDVTAYREQAAVVMNSPFIMSGGSISGSQIAVGGAGAHIAQQQSRPGS